MKYLYLLRHAKSAWDDDTLSDHQRTLSPRGWRHAPLIAEYIAQRFPAPDLAYCSDAVRTRETLRPVAKAWDLPDPRIRITPELYLADEKKLLAMIRSIPESCGRALLLGHNPGLTDVANRLVAKGEYVKNIPAAGFLLLELDLAAWADAAQHCATIRIRLKPRELFD